MFKTVHVCRHFQPFFSVQFRYYKNFFFIKGTQFQPKMREKGCQRRARCLCPASKKVKLKSWNISVVMKIQCAMIQPPVISQKMMGVMPYLKGMLLTGITIFSEKKGGNDNLINITIFTQVNNLFNNN